MSKHTPSPWLLEETTIYALNNERIPVNRFTASIDRGWGDDGKRIGQEEVVANAALMKAAPDLKDALQKLVLLYEADEGCRSMPEYIGAIAALKKATSISN